MGNVHRFRNFLVSKRIMDKKAEVGGDHDLPLELFCLTVPQKLYMNLKCFTDFGYR